MQSLQKSTLIVGMLAMLFLLPMADVYAASYTVCNSGCNYTTIASALSAVTSGTADTITVQSPYSGNENVTVSKSGASSTQPLVLQGDGSLPTLKGVTVTGSYVTIGGGTWASPLGFNITASSNARGSVDIEGNYVQVLYNHVSQNSVQNCEIGVDYAMEGSAGTTMPTYVTITGNTISNTLGAAGDWPLIALECQNCTVSQNDLSGDDIDGIHPWGNNITISNNYFHDFVLTNGSGAHMDMVQIWGPDPSDNGTSSCGTACANSYNIYFVGNVGYNITDDMCTLSWDYATNTSTSGIHDWYFENNLIVYTYAQANIGIPNMHFLNNTFIDNSYYNENMTLQIIGASTQPGAEDTGLVIENNVFLTTYNATPFVPDSNTTHSNNYTAVRSGSTYSAAGGWSETNGVNGGNPEFNVYSGTDSAGILPASILFAGSDTTGTNDFRLQSSSPLIGKGANLYSTFTTDQLNNTRPSSGNWDLGAYEYMATTLTPPAGLHLVPAN